MSSNLYYRRGRLRRFVVLTGLVVGALLFAACKSAQKPKGIFWRPAGTTVEVYKKKPETLGMTIYPSTSKEHRGAVLFIHGGGWSVGGSDVPLYFDWEPELRRAGLRAFSIEHRLAPKYRGHELIADCMDALAYIKKHARRFNIPEDRIAIVGFSSGGHLAVMTALLSSGQSNLARAIIAKTSGDIPPVRAVAAFYSPLDPASLFRSGNVKIRSVIERYLPRRTTGADEDGIAAALKREIELQRTLIAISPVRYLHRKSPPTILVHGMADELVPISQSEKYWKHAKALGLTSRVTLVSVPRAAHNFNLSRNGWARAAERKAIRFISDYLEK